MCGLVGKTCNAVVAARFMGPKGIDMGKPRTDNPVPCEGCSECCQMDAVFIHPELGDKASEYQTEVYQGRYVLAHKENGDCVYLKRGKGCTIHDKRPAICRELDCALFLLYSDWEISNAIKGGYLRIELLQAAKIRLSKEPDPMAVLKRLAEAARADTKGLGLA